MSGTNLGQQISETVEVLRKKLRVVPEIGLILGSGLGSVADIIADKTTIPYEDIPHFPISTVEGHAGELIGGTIGGRHVLALKGRFHLYEGYSAQQLTLPVRVMKELGVHSLMVTNAAGGVNPAFKPGDLMLITDHLNFTFHNPLVGPHEKNLGERFPDLSQAYDPELQTAAKRVASERGVCLQEGVYAGFLGPSYETPAEIRMIGMLGADAVGMSTVPEVIVARQVQLRVIGISCICCMAAGIDDQVLSHGEVMAAVEEMTHQFTLLAKGIIREM